jgi:hypothetical protein
VPVIVYNGVSSAHRDYGKLEMCVGLGLHQWDM